jgi:hypothetical protein
LENKNEFNGMVIFFKIAQTSCVLSTWFCGLVYLRFELVFVGVIVAAAVQGASCSSSSNNSFVFC